MKKLLLLCLLLASCARAPLEDPSLAFRPAIDLPRLEDSYSIGSLKEALARNLEAIRRGENIPELYQFGGRSVSRDEYAASLEALGGIDNFDAFHAFVQENFDFYEVYGNSDGWGRVFATGYYDAVVPGSRKRTERFSRPVRRMPPDLVTIDLEAYAQRFPQLEAVQRIKNEQKSRRPVWRGRLNPETRSVVPYYSRAEVEENLNGQGLEIAWLDPIDAFFIEIQGSGVVDLDGKQIRIGYAGQNGHPYVPIGRFLTHIIPLEQMSMQRIRLALNSMSPEQRDQILFLNPSYVFFQELSGLSLTYSGAEVTTARTIATDQFFFPKGTLNFLEIELPVFADAESLDPVAWELKPRWVFDQDTGGAIRGGGRVDLYMGQGPEAERLAGVMKRGGKLWTLAPKESFLERLRSARLE
jgi:membrane-bound lytic murein transglycosylase A